MSIDLYEQLSNERKQLQKDGLVPPWYITPGYQLFKEKYEYNTNDRSVRGQFERIASTLSNHLPESIREVANQKFFDLLWNQILSPSTPVLANTGTNRGLVVSCGGNVIDDSVPGFYESLTECATLSKYGFGTSSYLGNIRPRGSKISTGGKSSGIVPVFEDHVIMTSKVTQGTARRGAWGGYVPVSHGDFDELLDYISNNPDGANVGWNFYDEDIAKLNRGDEEMTRRWRRSLKLKMTNGPGYYFFPDKANRRAPEVYKKRGLKIHASNLCFTGDTLVSVVGDANSVRIDTLADVSNGEVQFLVNCAIFDDEQNKWINVERKATAFKTGERDVINVLLSNGLDVTCTSDHLFALEDGSYLPVAECIGKDLQTFDGSKLTVKDFKSLDSTYSVYDLTVEEAHNFYIQLDDNTKILVHNCSEIALASGIDPVDNEEISFSCVLSSMNILTYDKWKDTDAVFWTTIFLDCVASEFLAKAKGIKHLEKTVRFTERSRALGLGQCGFHSYLQTKMIPFDSFDAHLANAEISKHIYEESERASRYLAELLGEPEWCKGTGLRNAQRIAIAPTKSTSILMGGVSEGISPYPSNTYTQQTAAGEVDRINPILLDLMKQRGVYDQEHIDQIVNDFGSVKNVEWLSDFEKEVFKTAFEIDQFVIIKYASVRSKYVDQGQSLNLFFSASSDQQYISKVHQVAFEDENTIGLYYIYSSAFDADQKSLTCTSCQ